MSTEPPVIGLGGRIVAPLRRFYRLLRGREPLLHPELYDIGDRLSMGRHSYGKPLVRRYRGDSASTRVRVGSFTAIAGDVVIMIGGEHPTDRVSTFAFRARFGLPGIYEDGFPRSKGDIVIGNDVWICPGSKILSGVTVGDGAVVGAHSVVVNDVRPYAIVAGNPAQELRRRFTDDQIEALLRIRWWDWSDDEILDAVPALNSGSIEEFLARYGPGEPEARTRRRESEAPPAQGDSKASPVHSQAPDAG